MAPLPPDSWRERALGLFPGGSNGEFGIPADLIPVIERGHGCRVWDPAEWPDSKGPVVLKDPQHLLEERATFWVRVAARK